MTEAKPNRRKAMVEGATENQHITFSFSGRPPKKPVPTNDRPVSKPVKKPAEKKRK